jgi:hypothetical protein
MAIRNAEKARKSGLQFGVILVCINLFFSGVQREVGKLVLSRWVADPLPSESVPDFASGPGRLKMSSELI